MSLISEFMGIWRAIHADSHDWKLSGDVERHHTTLEISNSEFTIIPFLQRYNKKAK